MTVDDLIFLAECGFAGGAVAFSSWLAVRAKRAIPKPRRASLGRPLVVELEPSSSSRAVPEIAFEPDTVTEPPVYAVKAAAARREVFFTRYDVTCACGFHFRPFCRSRPKRCALCRGYAISVRAEFVVRAPEGTFQEER